MFVIYGPLSADTTQTIGVDVFNTVVICEHAIFGIAKAFFLSAMGLFMVYMGSHLIKMIYFLRTLDTTLIRKWKEKLNLLRLVQGLK